MADDRQAGSLWTPEEDVVLLRHVAKYGTKHWGYLQTAGILPHRDQKACCNRFILLKRKFFQARAKGQRLTFPVVPQPPAHTKNNNDNINTSNVKGISNNQEVSSQLPTQASSASSAGRSSSPALQAGGFNSFRSSSGPVVTSSLKRSSSGIPSPLGAVSFKRPGASGANSAVLTSLGCQAVQLLRTASRENRETSAVSDGDNFSADNTLNTGASQGSQGKLPLAGYGGSMAEQKPIVSNTGISSMLTSARGVIPAASLQQQQQQPMLVHAEQKPQGSMPALVDKTPQLKSSLGSMDPSTQPPATAFTPHSFNHSASAAWRCFNPTLLDAFLPEATLEQGALGQAPAHSPLELPPIDISRAGIAPDALLDQIASSPVKMLFGGASAFGPASGPVDVGQMDVYSCADGAVWNVNNAANLDLWDLVRSSASV